MVCCHGWSLQQQIWTPLFSALQGTTPRRDNGKAAAQKLTCHRRPFQRRRHPCVPLQNGRSYYSGCCRGLSPPARLKNLPAWASFSIVDVCFILRFQIATKKWGQYQLCSKTPGNIVPSRKTTSSSCEPAIQQHLSGGWGKNLVATFWTVSLLLPTLQLPCFVKCKSHDQASDVFSISTPEHNQHNEGLRSSPFKCCQFTSKEPRLC